MYAVVNIFNAPAGKFGKVISRHKSYEDASAHQEDYEAQLVEQMRPARVCFFPFAIVHELKPTKVGKWTTLERDVSWHHEC